MLVPAANPLQDRLQCGDLGLSFGTRNVLAASLLSERCLNYVHRGHSIGMPIAERGAERSD